MMNYLKPRTIEDVFDDFFAPAYGTTSRSMRTDIIEKENEYVLQSELPGFGKDDVRISLENGYLTIKAEKNSEKNDENEKYVRRERYYGSTVRRFYVGNVDENQISAKFNDGILEVSVPKHEKPAEEKTKYISIG